MSNESEHTLALEVADCAAPAYWESSCMPVEVDGGSWYDLDSLDDDERAELAGVIRYCELRGLMQRHPEKPNLFQTLEP